MEEAKGEAEDGVGGDVGSDEEESEEEEEAVVEEDVDEEDARADGSSSRFGYIDEAGNVSVCMTAPVV